MTLWSYSFFFKLLLTYRRGNQCTEKLIILLEVIHLWNWWQGFESSYAGSRGCSLNTTLKCLKRTDDVHLRVWVLEKQIRSQALPLSHCIAFLCTQILAGKVDMVTEPPSWLCSEDWDTEAFSTMLHLNYGHSWFALLRSPSPGLSNDNLLCVFSFSRKLKAKRPSGLQQTHPNFFWPGHLLDKLQLYLPNVTVDRSLALFSCVQHQPHAYSATYHPNHWLPIRSVNYMTCA